MYQRLETDAAVAAFENILDSQQVGAYACIKRCMDIAASLLALIACFPVFAATALLIKMDTSGPVFYRQYRRGLDGRLFKIWKFRTMTHVSNTDAESSITLPEDPRITRIGKLLRDTKVDELPQIFNILSGDMSIIGPRPLSEDESIEIESLGFASTYPGFHHTVRPGMIGLEQIMRRRYDFNLSYAKRFELNGEYAENVSFQMDTYIFFAALIQCRLVCSLAAISAVAEMALLSSM